MIDLNPHQHEAEHLRERQSRHEHVQAIPHQELWEVIEPDTVAPAKSILLNAREKIFSLGKHLWNESVDQYSWSIESCRNQCASFVHSTLAARGPLWNFLTQPVWVVNEKKKKMRKYNRLSLFLLDTVRFGGTFATIFLFLFVTLNYESFWKITSSYFNPILRIQQNTLSSNGEEAILKQKLLRSPSLATAGNSNGDLLSFLPPVGPPVNMLVVPKLNLNVPLITPSYESLLKEDWSTLEEDIQEGLQMGVVHYPGTARPGQAGNFFITGHSSYYPWAPGKYKTVFARLHELSPGDEYWVYYGGDKHRYIIQDKKEVKPTNVNVLDQPINKRISTLMTCTPVGTTLRRLIVIAQEVDPVTGVAMEVGQHETREAPQLKIEALPI